MAPEGRAGLLPIPRGSREHDSVAHLQTSCVPAMAECSGPPQSTRKDVLGTFYPRPEPVDSSTPSSAPLSRRTLLRHSSFVRAVCVDALVRICAGGDQRWSSLPRQLARNGVLGSGQLCPNNLCHLRGSPQNLGPISPEHQRKPGYKKYAEPRQINEIANQNLTTNQKVGSSSPPGRATLAWVQPGSIPDTWVTECTGYIGNNLGPDGLSRGSLTFSSIGFFY